MPAPVAEFEPAFGKDGCLIKPADKTDVGVSLFSAARIRTRARFTARFIWGLTACCSDCLAAVVSAGGRGAAV